MGFQIPGRNRLFQVAPQDATWFAGVVLKTMAEEEDEDEQRELQRFYWQLIDYS